MTPERWQRTKELLEKALERSPEDRRGFLDGACEGDAELCSEVEELLAVEGEMGDFIATPIFSFRRDGAEEDPNLGRRIGPFELIERLGRGGMGAVYLAGRADGQFEQRVAVKLLKRGMDTDEILRRFRTERQILANLRHDNIARLLDGGTTDDGLPYFVLEYVEGELIDRYCEARELSTAARLRLFRTVSAAVQFAHRNLIVHRDLKPGNILVTEDGVPKLLDFGIAKLLATEGGEGGLTVLDELPLTPGYASPEQLRGEPITTASDVYSLGVLLYELLTGRPPYRVDTLSRSEWLKVLAEQEPLRPSSVVRRRVEEGEPELERQVAAAERSDRRLRRRLAGDLDNIVLKAIAKEPERRYVSVEQLATDVDRYLSGLPVLARPATVGYRAAKFVRRHRFGVVGAAAVMALIVAVAGATLSQRRQRQEARRERDRAQAVTEFLVGVIRAPDPSQAQGQTVTAREILEQGAATVARELADQPESQATLLDAMARVYRNLGLYEDAERMLREALRLREEAFGREHPLVAESLHNLASQRRAAGRPEEAEGLIRKAVAIQRRTLPGDDLELAKGLSNLASLLADRGGHAEAEGLFRESLAIKRRHLDDADPGVLTTLNNIGGMRLRQGDHAEAERLFRQVLAGRRRILTAPHPDLATTLNNLATVLADTGRAAEAERLYAEDLAMRRQLYKPDNPKLATSVNNYASFLVGQGKHAEAVPYYREALATLVAKAGEESADVAQMKRNLASALAQAGEPGCEPLAREALAVFARPDAGEGWRAADGESVLGGCLAAMGRYEEAERLLVESLSALEQQGAAEPNLSDARQRVEALYAAWRKPEPAPTHRQRQAGS